MKKRVDGWRNEDLIEAIREILGLSPLYGEVGGRKAAGERYYTAQMQMTVGDGTRKV